jgi:hypothetical protein
MTQAAEIKELAERIKSFATAMEKPGADRQAEVASIDRCLVRIKALTSDIAVTVAHGSPRASRPPLVDQQTAEPVLGIK